MTEEKQQYTREEVEEIISKVRYKMIADIERRSKSEESFGSEHAKKHIRTNDSEEKTLSVKYLHCADTLETIVARMEDEIPLDLSFWDKHP